MNITVFNPNLYVQKNDKFTTGIVYMPVALAYLLSTLKSKYKINLIDLFGLAPKQNRIIGDKIVFGRNISEFNPRKFENTDIFFVYANQVANHDSVLEITRYVKKYYNKPVVILENSQAVTAYFLLKVKNDFLNAGVDYLIIGDLEKTTENFLNCFFNNKNIELVKGLIGKNFENSEIDFNEQLDIFKFPAWEFFPLKNYWELGYAHGPLSSDKYLPILTSRGCPYPCNFCVVPFTNSRKWRSRSPKSIVDEIKYCMQKFDVKEFHLEDLNPTVNDKRTKSLCEEIIKQKIKIKWKIVAGTKVESIKDDRTVQLMSKAGCTYVSISPESGSKDLMKKIDKPFNYDHALKIIDTMNKNKIFTQACFVIGFPGETNEDIKKTRKMIFDLTIRGIDEIAIFIITPIPGSKIYNKFNRQKLSELTFTPKWRNDYKKLIKQRMLLYFIFLITKLFFHPIKILKQIINFFRFNFQTKMEMVPYKFIKLSYFAYVKKNKD